jgi:hypothetical protein
LSLKMRFFVKKHADDLFLPQPAECGMGSIFSV